MNELEQHRCPKPGLIITAVVVEGRSQAEVARDYGVSQGVGQPSSSPATAPRVTPRSNRAHDDPRLAPTRHRPQRSS